MRFFGGRWQNYMNTARALAGGVCEQDTVVIGGDLLGALTLGVSGRFSVSQRAPGQKNHSQGRPRSVSEILCERWKHFLRKMAFRTFIFCTTIVFLYENTAICARSRSSRKATMRRFRPFASGNLTQGREKPLEPDKSYAFYVVPAHYANFRCGEIITVVQKYSINQLYLWTSAFGQPALGSNRNTERHRIYFGVRGSFQFHAHSLKKIKKTMEIPDKIS